jgi:hypothetical protein
VRIGGAWVGWGLGDSSDEIRAVKAHMRRKFSYARTLPDSPEFDTVMFEAVMRMQTAYHREGKLRKAPDGILDWATKVVCGYLTAVKPLDTRGMLFTACGTGVPWWVGPDADMARAVESKWLWQPIGYPAAPFPMNRSIQAGRAELVRQFEIHRDRIVKHGAAIAGYSQGAIVMSETWLDDVLAPTGRLAWARTHIRKSAMFGNPMRQAGFVQPDPGGPPAPMTSHGIADRLLTNTPPWWKEWAHAGDLYTDVEGESAENKTAIYKVVMGARITQGPDSLLAQVLELGTGSPAELIGMFKAIMDAGAFFVKGTGPHITYDPRPAAEHLLSS